MKNLNKHFFKAILIAILAIFSTGQAHAQGSVSVSGGTWTAEVNGNTVYTGNRMFDAVNAACNNMGGGTIDIWNSGSSGNDGGNVYAIRPQANQTLDFHGNTVNCNSNGDLVVAVHADRRNGITIRNLHVTGNPRYGLWFRGCSDITLTNITMDLSNNSPVGLGIRVDGSTGSASNLTINGNININGSAGHAIETYSVNGVDIGDVTVTNTGGCGVLLNDSENCNVGVVTGSYNDNGGGYATFRVANNNRSTYCEAVYSTNSGRGFFSVSGSQDCTVGYVEITGATDIGIWIQDSYNTHVNSGYVWNNNGGCSSITGGSGNSVNVSCSAPGNNGGGGGSYVQLQNRGTGLFLDGMGHTNNGDACGQWANTNHQNSHWELIDVGGGYYQLQNRGTGLFLDGMGRTTNGDACGQWANTSHQNSHWELEQYSGNYYRLQNRGTGLYLDGMGRTSNGSDVGQWANTTHSNAQWQLIDVSARMRSEPAEGLTAEAALYPNPVRQNEVVTISMPAVSEKASLEITDLTGKKLLTKQYHSVDRITFDPQLKEGIYMILLTADGMRSNYKLIVR